MRRLGSCWRRIDPKDARIEFLHDLDFTGAWKNVLINDCCPGDALGFLAYRFASYYPRIMSVFRSVLVTHGAFWEVHVSYYDRVGGFTLSHAAFFLYIPAVETERTMIPIDVQSMFSVP
jgi:hypothetical protein